MSLQRLSHAALTATKVSGEASFNGGLISPLQLPGCTKHIRSHGHVASTAETNDEFGIARSSQAPLQPPLGRRAKQKQADKELIVDLLSSAATRRDAKAYLSRLKSPTRLTPSVLPNQNPRSAVNLGNLFGRARAVDASPVFVQNAVVENSGFEEQEVQHVALVKMSETQNLPHPILLGIAHTLSQLSKLSMAPCIVLGANSQDQSGMRSTLMSEAERLSAVLDTLNERGARILDCVFTISETKKPYVSSPRLLYAPLKRGQIPIVVPVAYSSVLQKVVPISIGEAVIALASELSGSPIDAKATQEDEVVDLHWQRSTRPTTTSLDRIIIIDEAGGIPNAASQDGKHVFLNLEQEFDAVRANLHESGDETALRHIANLTLLQDSLSMLPHSSSGLMTTPQEASHFTQHEHLAVGPNVGTRRQKNTLIHNLLTDRPAYSASLPKTRLTRKSQSGPTPAVSTFIKRGMPVKMIPDPMSHTWTAHSPRIKLTDPIIDLERLVFLVNDSFNRTLDVDKYLDRVNENIAGVIIAGDYEGGAILTWETPPGIDADDLSRKVPYLDKFAVLKKSQGAGGVADIVFNAMVRTCFPYGVCWRSRKDNPVNKWYFERSSGTWELPGMNWTMFWTTPGVTQDQRTFQDYEGVCRNVQPTWKDTKSASL